MTTYEVQRHEFNEYTREYELVTMTIEANNLEDARIWARRNGWSVSLNQK